VVHLPFVSHTPKIQGNDITYKIAADTVSRNLFVFNGVLDNQAETNFRSINLQFPVFAISRNLGTIQATQAPVVWTVGYITDPAVNYTDLSGALTQRSLYFKSKYSDDSSLVSASISRRRSLLNVVVQIVDFLNDFNNASSRAQQLDQHVLQDAASISGLYGDLVSLAIAQTYGSTQLTIGFDATGNFNKSDVMMFMKNVGGEKAKLVNPNSLSVVYGAESLAV
jgi:hypothetical protein